MQVHERYLGRTLRCTSCRTEFLAALPEGVEVVEPPPELPQLDKPERTSSRRLLWLALAVVLVAVALWWLGQGGHGGVRDALFRPQRVNGEMGVLEADASGPVVVALDRDAVARLVKAGLSPESGDARGVVEDGHGLEVAAGTQVRVIERIDRGRALRVRILSGPWASRVVWVPSRWVR
jgi:hypothetical protein